MLTIHFEAVRGTPSRSHFWLCKCQCTIAAKPIPIGVHFNNKPLQVNQPPAANNHQSNTDNIVQPAPAFQFHDLRIFLNWLNLPFLDEDCFPSQFLSTNGFVEYRRAACCWCVPLVLTLLLLLTNCCVLVLFDEDLYISVQREAHLVCVKLALIKCPENLWFDSRIHVCVNVCPCVCACVSGYRKWIVCKRKDKRMSLAVVIL